MFGNLTPAAEALAKFKEYYITIWPVLIVIHILAIITFKHLFKKTSNSDKVISAVLVFLWLWDGIVHQGILAAYPPQHFIPMVTLFVIQGLLMLYHGVIKSNLTFDYVKGSWKSRLGVFYMVYALIGYLIIGTLLGHPFTKGGVFFANICAFDCFTCGLLMMSDKKTPKYLIIIPLLWSQVGGLLAMFAWHIWDDFGLVSSGFIATIIVLFRNAKSSELNNRDVTRLES
jgi:hypothetical protein